MAGRKRDKNDELICSCNEVPRSVIQAAMANGKLSLAEIFDATWAGCGPCGGTCQPRIVEMLRNHLACIANTEAELVAVQRRGGT